MAEAAFSKMNENEAQEVAPETSMVLDVQRSLIARAQGGDVAAFETLIGQHLDRVRRFARAFAQDDATADDLAQDAIIKVYKSINSYRFASAFSTWLYAIVRNVFLDEIKSRAHRNRAVEDSYTVGTHDQVDLDGSGPNQPDHRLEQEQERRRVWAAIEQLPPEFRGTIVMFDIEGMSHDEIAAIEKVALGTVKSRLNRAREYLRRLLGSERNLDRSDLVQPQEAPLAPRGTR
jgi:RNA polymerase sigma-70 factor, ECF subfamily